MKTSDIRKAFLDFFEARLHRVVKSDSLIPADDPTVLFTGAGMNQFKDYFLGMRKDMSRATSCQKCLRTGDLDNVGKTAYHHSFFEMLGNFSFGDYFKEDAILWAWEFLTKAMRIPAERLSVSVHTSDQEAFDLWKNKIGLPAARIARLGDHSNMWPANVIQDGPNGPCGPCSEIFFDQGKETGCGKCGCNVDCDCGRFAEIWNLVFTQFDRKADGSLEPLAARNIDTGMGLERLACVMQGKRYNFETDIFDDLLRAIQKQCTHKNAGEEREEKTRTLTYGLADHMRAVTFTITDGAYPSNEGRGYVIRKLIRRSVWKARQLGIALPALFTFTDVVVRVMRDAYPELAEHHEYVRRVVKNEEERFLSTLENGLRLIAGKKTFSSEDIFLLYDTYGFPAELTVSIAEERGVPFNLSRFEALMEAQRERAKQNSVMSDTVFAKDQIRSAVADSHIPKTVFCGYDRLSVDDAEVQLLMKPDGTICKALSEGVEGLCVTAKTPFYPEGGGQVGDVGEFSVEGGVFGDIKDTFKKDDLIFHRCIPRRGTLRTGNHMRLEVNRDARAQTMYNHTATHLLHAALRTVLGTHVRQLGSVVEPARLRFDFSHFQAMTADEVGKVEQLVNDQIAKAVPLEKAEQSFEQAKEGGALAFFGEKYGSRVRVVSVPGFSKELCGGTHVQNTKEIGRFKIISESSVGSGTRRIVALTSTAIEAYEVEQKHSAARELKLAEARHKRKAEEAHIVESRLKNMNPEQWVHQAVHIGRVPAVIQYLEGLDPKRLGALADQVKEKMDFGLVLLFSQSDDKLHIIATARRSKEQPVPRAGSVVQKVAGLVNGRGGGRDEFAQGGGEVPKNKDAFMKDVSALLKELCV